MKAYGYIVRWEPNRNGILAPEQTWEGETEEVVRWKDFLGWNPEADDEGCFEALVTVTEDVVMRGNGQTVVMKRGMEVIRDGVKNLMLQAVADTEGWCRRLERELEETKPKFKVGDIVRLKSGGSLYDFGNIPLRDMKVESVWETSKGDGSTGWRYHVTIMKIDGMGDEIGEYAESRCFDLCEELLERSE